MTPNANTKGRKMKTKAELLEGIDKTELPATRVDEALLTAEPLDTIEPGDKVVVHSRGYYRLAVALEVTPKRCMVAYTTEGAWKEAQKIVDNRLAPGFVAAVVANYRLSATKNYDFLVEASTTEWAAKQVAKWSHITPESAEVDRQKYAAKLAELGDKDAHVAAEVEKAHAQATAWVAEARERGAAAYCAVTTKSVKRSEVFGLAAR